MKKSRLIMIIIVLFICILRLYTSESEHVPGQDGKVKLDIFNIRGQKVTTLLNESLIKGSHIIKWDGKDDNSKMVGSGVYLYRIQTEGHSVTKHMVLMK